MTKPGWTGPAEIVLAARVARMYFLENASKIDIAATLDISRFRVARLLEQAQQSGLVRVEISIPGTLDADLSAELASAFRLRHAFVYDFPDDAPGTLGRRLAEAAGEAVRGVVKSSDVLGIAWSRSLARMARNVSGFAACATVQMTGALEAPGAEDLLDLVRSLSRLSGGPSYGFYAPMIVDDAVAAAAIRRHRDVKAAFDQMESITVGLVGIGPWEAELSSVYDAVDRERAELAASGVFAEISGVFVDESGRPVATSLDDRMIITPADVLKKIPTVIAVTAGAAKAPAVEAALRGGLVNGLITDAGSARALVVAAGRSTTDTRPQRMVMPRTSA